MWEVLPNVGGARWCGDAPNVEVLAGVEVLPNVEVLAGVEVWSLMWRCFPGGRCSLVWRCPYHGGAPGVEVAPNVEVLPGVEVQYICWQNRWRVSGLQSLLPWPLCPSVSTWELSGSAPAS